MSPTSNNLYEVGLIISARSKYGEGISNDFNLFIAVCSQSDSSPAVTVIKLKCPVEP